VKACFSVAWRGIPTKLTGALCGLSFAAPVSGLPKDAPNIPRVKTTGETTGTIAEKSKSDGRK
jgi:hypothetical protein